MKKQTEKTVPSEGGFDVGFGGILKGLGGLVEKLGELAETGREFAKTGEVSGLGRDKEIKGVYGFTVQGRSRRQRGEGGTLRQHQAG